MMKPSGVVALGVAILSLFAGLGMIMEAIHSKQAVNPWEIGMCLAGAIAFLLLGLRYLRTADKKL